MAFTPFYTIQVNVPFTATFENPSVFSEKMNQWGKMNYNYQVRIGGTPHTLSADEKLHPLIQQHIKELSGGVATIVKRQKPNASGTGKTNSYEITCAPASVQEVPPTPSVPTTQCSSTEQFDTREELICRQTALKVAGENNHAKAVQPEELLEEADIYFMWITTGIRPLTPSKKTIAARTAKPDEIQLSDIPF